MSLAETILSDNLAERLLFEPKQKLQLKHRRKEKRSHTVFKLHFERHKEAIEDSEYYE